MTTIKVIFNKINVDIQKAASKKGRRKKANYQLLLSIAIGIFGYFH